MEEFYKAIEDKIKASGYPGEVNGEDIYNDICDQMEEKENGTYLFLSKKDNGVVFEYKVDILDESFNLSYVHITANNDTFHRQSFLGHPCIFDIQGYFFKDFFGKCEHCALYRGLL